MNKLLFTLLVISAALVGCNDDKDSAPGIYLTKVIYHQDADQIRHYFYNDQGLLSKREYTFEHVLAEQLFYEYNDQQLGRIDFYSLGKNGLAYENHIELKSEADKIVQFTLFPEQQKYAFEWNDNNMIKQTKGSDFTEFVYDANGNITEERIYYGGEQHYKVYYEYDTKKNPLHNLDPIHDMLSFIDFIHYKCPNNVVKMTSFNKSGTTISVSEFVYKYNEHDLPVEADEIFTSESNGYDHEVIEHLLFEYEIKAH